MQWTAKPRPKEGDTRIVIRWCILPITIDGVTRWLQRSKVKQRLTRGVCHPPDMKPYPCLKWFDVEWID